MPNFCHSNNCSPPSIRKALRWTLEVKNWMYFVKKVSWVANLLVKFVNRNMTLWILFRSVLSSEENEALASEFRAVYKKNGEEDLFSQVPYLSRLAEHYEATAALNGNDWVNLLKVFRVMCLSSSMYGVFPCVRLHIVGNIWMQNASTR